MKPLTFEEWWDQCSPILHRDLSLNEQAQAYADYCVNTVLTNGEGKTFEAYWATQDTGLGDAHKFTAWNTWLVATAVERERCARLAETCAQDGSPMLHNLADEIRRGE